MRGRVQDGTSNLELDARSRMIRPLPVFWASAARLDRSTDVKGMFFERSNFNLASSSSSFNNVQD